MTRLSKPVATIETLKHLVSNSDKKYATKDSLSTVATTGNYSDLKGTPLHLKTLMLFHLPVVLQLVMMVVKV